MKEQLEPGDMLRKVVFSNITIDVIIWKVTEKFAYGIVPGTHESQTHKFSRIIRPDGIVKHYGAQKYDTPYKYIQPTTNKELN